MAYHSIRLQRKFCISHIIRIYYFEYAPNFDYKGETHDFWEVVYVDNGAIQVQAGNKQQLVERGQAIFHEPNEFHSLRAHNSCPNLIILSFSCNSPALHPLKQLLCHILPTERTLLGQLVAEAQLAFLEPVHRPTGLSTLRRNPNAPFGSEQLLAVLVEQFLLSVLRRTVAQRQTKQLIGLDIRLPESQNEHLQRMFAFLSQNLHRRLSVADICKESGISRSRLQQLCEEELKCGVAQCFQRLKTDAAKILLRSGGKSIAEIADTLGYSSVAHFSRQFYKCTGISPRKYQKRIVDITQSVSTGHL